MSNVKTTRIDVPEDGRPGVPAGAPDAYRKPTLRRLGQWNLFTRQTTGLGTSDDTGDSGFFEFNLGR